MTARTAERRKRNGFFYSLPCIVGICYWQQTYITTKMKKNIFKNFARDLNDYCYDDIDYLPIYRSY